MKSHVIERACLHIKRLRALYNAKVAADGQSCGLKHVYMPSWAWQTTLACRLRCHSVAGKCICRSQSTLDAPSLKCDKARQMCCTELYFPL